MALVKHVYLDNGIELPEAYIKIVDVKFRNHPEESPYVEVVVNVYKDQESRNLLRKEVFSMVHICEGIFYDQFFDPSIMAEQGKNVFTQAYEFLKSLAYYVNSTDIIDEEEL